MMASSAVPIAPCRQWSTPRSWRHHALGFALGHFDQAIGPVIGKVTVIAVCHDPKRHAPQVLNQRQAQHDRDGP